jgi:hypothetical protein
VTLKITLPPPAAVGAESKPRAAALPPFTIDAALWERLISRQPKHNMLSAAGDAPVPTKSHESRSVVGVIEPAPHMIREDQAPAGVQPGGMIPQPLLDKWIESEQRFTGVVVSIGINDVDSSMWHSRGVMPSVGNYIAGLLKGKDYCCRTSYDEFLMVCPGEQGAQAQRRLSHISAPAPSSSVGAACKSRINRWLRPSPPPPNACVKPSDPVPWLHPSPCSERRFDPPLFWVTPETVLPSRRFLDFFIPIRGARPLLRAPAAHSSVAAIGECRGKSRIHGDACRSNRSRQVVDMIALRIVDVLGESASEAVSTGG